MARYGFFTFRAHPSDVKDLNKELISLLQPLISKLDQYVLSIESENQPEEHIHLLFRGSQSMNDSSKVRQRIESKSLKSFIKNRLPETMTEHKCAFDYRIVGDSEEDYLKITGYVAKEKVKQSKGYSQEYITRCIQFYYDTQKLSIIEGSKQKDRRIKTLKPNEVLTYMEDFCDKNGISYNDPYIFTKMKCARISFVQVSRPQRETLRQEFVLMNKDKVGEFQYNYATKKSNEDEDQDTSFQQQEYLNFIRRLFEANDEQRGSIIAATYMCHFTESGQIKDVTNQYQ